MSRAPEGRPLDCDTVQRLGLADEYRAWRLTTEETEAYEEHYFACERCFQDLLFRDRIAGHVREQGARLFAEELRGPDPARPASARARPAYRPKLESEERAEPLRERAARASWFRRAPRAREEETVRKPARPEPSRRERPAGARPQPDREDRRPDGPAQARPVQLGAASGQEDRAPARTSWWWRPLPGSAWVWRLGPIALAVAVALVAGIRADRREHMRLLADAGPYPYTAAELRGEDAGSPATTSDNGSTAPFARGMEHYAARRYASAEPLLAQASRAAPRDAEAAFYLGVTRLLLDRPGEAEAALRVAVTSAPTSGLYRWYLAQAFLRRGDGRAALRELDRLAAGSDEFSEKARALRTRIRAIHYGVD